jgi:hypothetical protein
MSFCTKCGTHNDADSRFCQNCGATLSATSPVTPASPVAPAAAPRTASSAGTAAPAGLGRLIARAKAITLSPNLEWPVIEGEPDQPKDLIINYVAILAAITPIASFIGMTLIGISMPFVGTVRIGFLGGLGTMVTTYVFGIAAIFLMAWIADALAPTFNGQKNFAQAFKLVAYAYTPAWLAGVFNVIPLLGILAGLAGLYSLYVLYLGVPVMMKCPKEKALPYTVVLILVGIVASVILGAVTTRLFMPTPSFGGSAKLDPSSTAGAVLGGLTGTTDTAEATKRLEAMGKSVEEAAKRAEEASKSGDANAAAAAAGQVMGAVLGAGGKVDTIAFQELKAMLPESLGSLPRTSITGEKTAMGGASVSTAEGRYQDNQASVELKVTDMGGVGFLMAGMAAWSMVEMDRETESGRERSGKADGRPFHEQYDNRSRSGEFDLVVGQRFLIEAKGRNVDLGTLKSAVGTINLARLESMKDVGRSAN